MLLMLVSGLSIGGSSETSGTRRGKRVLLEVRFSPGLGTCNPADDALPVGLLWKGRRPGWRNKYVRSQYGLADGRLPVLSSPRQITGSVGLWLRDQCFPGGDDGSLGALLALAGGLVVEIMLGSRNWRQRVYRVAALGAAFFAFTATPLWDRTSAVFEAEDHRSNICSAIFGRPDRTFPISDYVGHRKPRGWSGASRIRCERLGAISSQHRIRSLL